MVALACFLIAFTLSYFGTLALLHLPTGRGFVDVPSERSSHQAPKPRIGGMAIVVSFYAAYCFLVVAAPATRVFAPLAIGAGMLFVTGVVDDWRGLGVKVRFAVQIVAALTMVYFGVVLDHVHVPAVGDIALGWMSAPVTVLLVMVSVNFYNFIDGIDGLAGGSAFIASGFLALIAAMLGHGALALIFLAVAGSAIGFLHFNFPPSRTFMGDSGSTFLGYFFAYVAVWGNRLTPELPVFITLLVLSSLYLDAGLTLAGRLMRRENVLRPHHTHYYQRLLSLGFNHKQITLLEYLLVILLGVSAVVYFKAGGFFPLFLSVCWFTLFTLLVMKIRGLERGDKMFWERRTLFMVALDLVLITAAYLGAYFLRMNFRFTDAEGTAVLRALPIVLVVRSAVFYRYGLYRSVWKYTSTADIVRILKAVTVGSAIILTAVVLLYRFVAFPRTLFIIEFFLLTLLVLGSRFSFRIFHEIGKEAHGANVRRYGIIGAGDLGERLAREIRNDPTRSAVVNCFIDDDPGKIGLMLHGAPIVGPLSTLSEVCEARRLDTLVLGIAEVEAGKLGEITRQARAAGVPLEARHSALWRHEERPEALFERLRTALGRTDTGAPDRSSVVFYRGRRVLITGGGGPIGPALAGELVQLGAFVTVQADSPVDAERFGALRGDVFLHIGPLADRAAIADAIGQADPDVVFHCVTLETAADHNVENYVWDAALMRTAGLCAVAADSAVSDIVLVSFWGDLAADSDTVAVGAAAEAFLLNDASLGRMGPKALRFPTILTSSALLDLHRGGCEASDATRESRRYRLLEPDAVRLVVGCAAAEPGREIVVPKWDRSLSGSEAVRVLSSSAASAIDGPGDPDGMGPVFPNESAGRATVVPGGVRVTSPIYPADVAFSRVTGREFLDCPREGRAEALRVLTAGLHRAATAARR